MEGDWGAFAGMGLGVVGMGAFAGISLEIEGMDVFVGRGLDAFAGRGVGRSFHSSRSQSKVTTWLMTGLGSVAVMASSFLV